MGAGLIYAEMVSDKAIGYGNEKTFEEHIINERVIPFMLLTALAGVLFMINLIGFIVNNKKYNGLTKGGRK